MGEVVVADGTVTGEGIVLAQRLEQLAEAGGVCIQGAAYDTVPKRLPFAYENLGERELKGFEEPVRIYAIRQGLPATTPDSKQFTLTLQKTVVETSLLPCNSKGLRRTRCSSLKFTRGEF